MRLVRKLKTYTAESAGIVLTIGNFDGLHLGHREILRHLKEKAAQENLPACVMCFEPQPLEYFKSGAEVPARLSTFREKVYGFAKLGIDTMFCLRFDRELASMKAEDFVSEIICRRLNVRFLLVGDDFHFGQGGQGDYNLLTRMGKELGFEVASMSSYCREFTRVSSTRIRELLAQDRLTEVSSFLGEPFFITGKVSHGRELGRTISFPTANINLKRRQVPLKGVYAVNVTLPNGEVRHGIANVGVCPTVNGTKPRLEVFLLDFKGNLYSALLKVSFVAKLREERKFVSLAELKEQLALDELKARKLFKMA